MSARFDVNTFTAQYTQWNVDKGAQNGTAIEYKSEDSRYRVYIPGKNDKKSSAKAVSGGGLHVVLACDHIIGGVIATDDHTTVTMDFDASGALKDASQEIEITEGGVHPIPDWVPKALELGVEALGALGALETAGISEVVAQEVVADIQEFCNAFNKVAGWINKFTDDGGRLNFPAEVVHSMNRACVSVLKS